MPTDNPKKLIAFNQDLFDLLDADATRQKRTVQAIVRDICAGYYGLPAADMTWGQVGKSWGNGYHREPEAAPAPEPKPKPAVKRTPKRKGAR